MIGGAAGERQEQDLGRELQRGHNTKRQGVMRGKARRYQPVLGGTLHPGTEIRPRGRGRPETVIASIKRARPRAGTTPARSPGALGEQRDNLFRGGSLP